MPGTLYLCATPIGNLGDMTPRVVETLQTVDVIAAEDTRNSIKLLNHFDIHTPMTSYHEYNKVEKAHQLVGQLLNGQNIALITDAGTPAISDPGEVLVRMCQEQNVPVTSLPGPAACITALTLSGLSTRRFCFEGFLPADKKEKKAILEELKTELESMGEKAFRAKQMYEWMHVKLARSFDEMTNLSAKFREQCKEKYEYTCVKPVRIQESKIDGTKKFLFELSDGNVVESVWMQYKHGNSVCISSQVGCRMGCRFCASTLDGLERNLTPSEMLDQIYAITRLTQERVSNVVVMGTGEPMDNYDNILKFLHLLTRAENATAGR